MNRRDEQIEAAIEQRATEWFVRHRDGQMSGDEQAQYLQWLRASPQNVAAYLDLIALTEKLPAAASALSIDLDSLAREVRLNSGEAERALFTSVVQAPEQSSVTRRRLRPALAASILALVCAGAFWATRHAMKAPSVSVPVGQQRMLTLSDGSIAHLNSNTRLVLHYSATRRLIEMSEGQALFNVTHDARRPFIVRAGRQDVVALGTEFDVLRRGTHTEVTVVEGRIEIIDPTAGRSLRLGAGERATLSDGEAAVQRATPDVQLATAWARKRVSFSAERLEDVAAQFNRATGSRIQIEDPELRDYRISGVFQAYDLDSFVAYLKAFERVDVERDGDEVRVRERR